MLPFEVRFKLHLIPIRRMLHDAIGNTSNNYRRQYQYELPTQIPVLITADNTSNNYRPLIPVIFPAENTR